MDLAAAECLQWAKSKLKHSFSHKLLLYKLGVDLGGTKTEAILLDDHFDVLERKRIKTPHDNYDEIINSLFVFFNLSEIKLKKEDRKNIGVGKGKYPSMNEKTRDFLIDYYKPHNEKLYNLIGKKFDWDK